MSGKIFKRAVLSKKKHNKDFLDILHANKKKLKRVKPKREEEDGTPSDDPFTEAEMTRMMENDLYEGESGETKRSGSKSKHKKKKSTDWADRFNSRPHKRVTAEAIMSEERGGAEEEDDDEEEEENGPFENRWESKTRRGENDASDDEEEEEEDESNDFRSGKETPGSRPILFPPSGKTMKKKTRTMGAPISPPRPSPGNAAGFPVSHDIVGRLQIQAGTAILGSNPAGMGGTPPAFNARSFVIPFPRRFGFRPSVTATVLTARGQPPTVGDAVWGVTITAITRRFFIARVTAIHNDLTEPINAWDQVIRLCWHGIAPACSDGKKSRRVLRPIV